MKGSPTTKTSWSARRCSSGTSSRRPRRPRSWSGSRTRRHRPRRSASGLGWHREFKSRSPGVIPGERACGAMKKRTGGEGHERSDRTGARHASAIAGDVAGLGRERSSDSVAIQFRISVGTDALAVRPAHANAFRRAHPHALGSGSLGLDDVLADRRTDPPAPALAAPVETDDPPYRQAKRAGLSRLAHPRRGQRPQAPSLVEGLGSGSTMGHLRNRHPRPSRRSRSEEGVGSHE